MAKCRAVTPIPNSLRDEVLMRTSKIIRQGWVRSWFGRVFEWSNGFWFQKNLSSFLPKIGYWDGLEGHLHNLRHVKSKLSSMRQFHTVLGIPSIRSISPIWICVERSCRQRHCSPVAAAGRSTICRVAARKKRNPSKPPKWLESSCCMLQCCNGVTVLPSQQKRVGWRRSSLSVSPSRGSQIHRFPSPFV